MRTQLAILILLAAGLASLATPLAAQPPQIDNARFETASAAAGLEAAVRQAGAGGREPVWVGWTVPMISRDRFLCCLGEKGGKKWQPTACHLEQTNQSWGSTDEAKAPPNQDLLVLARLRGQEIEKVRAFSATCPIDADGRRFVWLGAVKPEESVALVAKAARRQDRGAHDYAEDTLAALSFHRNAGADDVLEGMASAPNSAELREHALFWIGQNRGERGARFLGKVMTGDPDEEIRKKAIFSLSQSDAPGVAGAIVGTARNDRSAEVRGEALFWLAQMGDAQAPEVILQAIERDPDLEVRKKGVFALTQLPKDQGVPYLIRLGREGKQREIRKEALFWLAQSDDPAALRYLDKVLNE